MQSEAIWEKGHDVLEEQEVPAEEQIQIIVKMLSTWPAASYRMMRLLEHLKLDELLEASIDELASHAHVFIQVIAQHEPDERVFEEVFNSDIDAWLITQTTGIFPKWIEKLGEDTDLFQGSRTHRIQIHRDVLVQTWLEIDPKALEADGDCY